MKWNLLTVYLAMGIFVCSCYTIAAARGWKAPNLGVLYVVGAILDGGPSSGGYYGGRSSGGSWGGGK